MVYTYKDPWLPIEGCGFWVHSWHILGGETTISELLHSNGLWNTCLMQNVLDMDEAQAVLSFLLTQNRTIDLMGWIYTNNRQYSVKSGYRLAYNFTKLRMVVHLHHFLPLYENNDVDCDAFESWKNLDTLCNMFWKELSLLDDL